MALLYRSGWILNEVRIALILSGIVVAAYNGDPPSFVTTPPPLKIARQGQSLLLKCRATGSPEPVISWRKDGRLVADGEGGIRLSRGDLAVTSLNTSHRGKYTCLAQSVEGQIRFTTDVKVEAPPEFVKRPTDLIRQEGVDAMFECKATGYPTEMKYRWTYNGEPVGISTHLRGRFIVLHDGSLVIYNIKPSDRGNVSCSVDNDFGVSPTATASLYVEFRARVTYMPAIAYAGLDLKAILRCPSEAEPPVNKVVWRKDGRGISPHQDPRFSFDADGSLIIRSASYADAGHYTCTPYNMRGTLGESTATELRIRDPPYFTHKPDKMYEAELGKSISIQCKGQGDPPPAVSWRKVEEPEPIDYYVDMGMLTINPVIKAVHGTWQCVLTNSVAVVAENIKIYVKYTIPHQVTNVSAKAIGETAIRVEWTPGYDGGHPQNFIVWYRQAGEHDPSWQTYDVGVLHKAAVLDELTPNTIYEIAVLPENKIRSGPFSETVTAKTRASRPPVTKDFSLLPVPQTPYSSTTDDGLVQLSWRKPNSYHQQQRRLGTAQLEYKKILGFLVEFRWIEVAEVEAESLRNKGRTKRAAKMPERGKWEILTTTYENITTVIVQPDQLYRDLGYEFRVFTASHSDYSMPSTPVAFSTKGLTAYPCYTGTLRTGSVLDNPVIAGVLAGLALMFVIIVISVFCFCHKKRKRDAKKVLVDVPDSEVPTVNTTRHTKVSMNGGRVIANRQPIVVDLTEKGTGGYGTMERREYETNGSDDDVKTPFIRNNNNIEESSKLFTAFIARHNSNNDTDSRKETLSSDRSSVRLRRETAPKVLLEQYKRRSLTDQTYHRIHRDIPLRGGTRSASTSPERHNIFNRPEDLNVTAPAALPDNKGRKRIRLYSRPIDDSGSAQQRRMIVIKRKSHKSSSSDAAKKNSTGAPPSDSSESPVFGVVGTLKQSSADSLDNPHTTSPFRRSTKSSSYRGRQHYPTANFENDVFQNYDDVRNNKHDDVIRSPSLDCTTPLTDPIYTSSPNDHSSPDVSPNRVIARRTVEYDPKVDPVIRPRPFSESPTRRGHHNKANSLTHDQRAAFQPARSRSEHHRNYYPYGGVPPHDPYERGRTQRYYQNPAYQMILTGPPRTRYSYAQQPQMVPHSSSQYHPAPPINNTSRSRASYSFGPHQPVGMYSPPPTVYDHPSRRVHATSPSTAEQQQPTCEIDCSNSDIEVRFLKDPDGNYHPPLTWRRGDVVSPVTTQLSSSVTTQMAGNSTTPTGGGSAYDYRHRSDSGKNETHPKNLNKSPSPARIVSPNPMYPYQKSTASSLRQTSQGKSHPRHMVPLSTSLSPSRHVKLKSIDGPDSIPQPSPLAAVGSSDYGSQDTSNSSTSPHVNSQPQGAPTSPSHLRFPGALQDRLPRRDNSSVEDNYEWDSEIAMESEILEALRHFGTMKKSGPVSDELLDELNKITKDTKNLPQRQRAHSADILDSRTSQGDDENEERESLIPTRSPGPAYSKESMARRCAALRAEFLHYQQLQQLDEDVT